MAIYQKAKLELVHEFDTKKCRHFVNGTNYVLHCHHYSTLFTQLAIDADEMWNATRLLKESAQDSFKKFFDEYFSARPKLSLEEKISLGEQYFAFAGLGKMNVTCAGENSGEIVLETSHIDSGWIKKWGKTDKPVNFITCGFILALFSSIFNENPDRYEVRENESIVCGSPISKFVIYKK